MVREYSITSRTTTRKATGYRVPAKWRPQKLKFKLLTSFGVTHAWSSWRLLIVSANCRLQSFEHFRIIITGFKKLLRSEVRSGGLFCLVLMSLTKVRPRYVCEIRLTDILICIRVNDARAKDVITPQAWGQLRNREIGPGSRSDWNRSVLFGMREASQGFVSNGCK